MISPFDLYTASVKAAWGARTPSSSVVERVKNHSTEKAVINLERMFLGLTSTE